MLSRLALAALLPALARSQVPPLGPLSGGLRPLSRPTFSLRHCSFVASFCPTDDSNADFSFSLVPGVGGAPSTYSFESAGYPGMYLGLKNASSGALGLIQPPSDGTSAAAASFALAPPLAAPPPGTPSVFSLVSQAPPPWGGLYVTFTNGTAAPCAYPPPSGDAMLTDGSAGGGTHATLMLGAAAPQAPMLITVDTATVTNPAVNPKFLGCHHDYGFEQAPRGFLGNLLYGSSFEAGTQGVPAWLPFGTGPAPAPADASSFSGKPSMSFSLDSDSGESGLRNRGIGGEGLALEGGKPYTVSLFLWSGGTPSAFVELFDTASNTSLARADFVAVTTGPDWGSTWQRFNFTLTPSAGTQCVGIPFGSDPAIDCGGAASPAHVCVRCGGEFRVGISSKGNFKVGYIELMPGAWGLLASKRGEPIPVLKSAGDALTSMGVTVMRNGGSVSQSMRWKDWRGPVWNRPSQQQAWGKSLLSGWGPFDYIEMAEALDIEPIVTLAYDSNDALDFGDLVEYCWGSAESTAWGARRAADRGHDAPYNITVFELGNEQYNPFFVEQVLAMEARSAAVGSPPLRYMFPDNDGLRSADAARLLAAAPGVVPRILPDLHVGAGGAVDSAAALFANPPTPGFSQGAINCETNAGTHDLQRALDEAADLIAWFTADTAVTDRLYARTASFCTGSSNNFDSWDQSLSMFLPNMTWLQPPGHVHAMVKATWAEATLAAAVSGSQAPFAAQRTADGKTLVLRVVNSGDGALPVQVALGGAAVAGPSFAVWTLGGQGLSRAADNYPAKVDNVAPVRSDVPIAVGARGLNVTLEATQFAVLVIPLQ